MKIEDSSHKRFNILIGEWVLVSPQRNKRPWQGKFENIENIKLHEFDESCYLCPGNKRTGGNVNPDYKDVYVFNNDFAAIQNIEVVTLNEEDLFVSKTETGICRVICYSPNHSLTMANMELNAIEKVIETWKQEFQELGKLEHINNVQIFENKGSIMGCSNPHPHGQIWAQDSIPNEVIKKNDNQINYYQNNKSNLLLDYLNKELEKDERIVFQNKDFVVLVPFWAVWPFETMIIPKKPQANILAMSEKEVTSFAEALHVLTNAYDKLFQVSFPYSSGIHQAPTNKLDDKHWQWHMSFYPPLLRSSTIKKFMVGYEMFGMPQRDITAEIAAKMITEKIN